MTPTVMQTAILGMLTVPAQALATKSPGSYVHVETGQFFQVRNEDIEPDDGTLKESIASRIENGPCIQISQGFELTVEQISEAFDRLPNTDESSLETGIEVELETANQFSAIDNAGTWIGANGQVVQVRPSALVKTAGFAPVAMVETSHEGLYRQLSVDWELTQAEIAELASDREIEVVFATAS